MEIIFEDEQDRQKFLVLSYGDGVLWSRGRLLGEGGFGAVFLATTKHPMSSLIAVKSAEVSSSASLQHEKKVLHSLVGCPNVIQCLGEEITTGINGSKFYNLLLEYGSGGDLAQRIENSRGRGLPELEVRRYTRSILKGLLKIHEAGYVHCDLKPQNILLVPTKTNCSGTPRFNAKICDFGLAKGVNEDRQKRKLQRGWGGTPLYLPPEAVKQGLQEPPGDIWALGCIVLEMLTGRSAWDSKEGPPSTQEKMIGKLAKGMAVPNIPKELSDDAKTFLRCCLKRMVKNRATAKTFLRYHPFVQGLNDEDDDTEFDNGASKNRTVATKRVEVPRIEEVPKLQLKRKCNLRSILLQQRPLKLRFVYNNK